MFNNNKRLVKFQDVVLWKVHTDGTQYWLLQFLC